MRRIILGILFVVMASNPIQAWYKREYRDEYTSDWQFIRVLANLTQVPDDIPAWARTVNLRYNMITDIPINAFSNLQCQNLLISYNEISVIESGSFNGLNSLNFLSITHNKITTLGDDSFSGLTSLTTLFIGYNNISAIPEGAFTSLSSMKTIHLDGNNIQTVPANVFPNTLERLILSRNKISALEDVAYKNLVSLTDLQLRYNSISTIPANAFSTLSNCKFLFLHHNPIKNIEFGAFNGLDKFTSLELQGTSLTQLSQNMFQGLPSLQRLRLHASRIAKIARGAFMGFDQLKYLQLSVNELTVLESSMFLGLSSLKQLKLLRNNIHDIKDFAFLMLGNLTNLDLYENQLEHLSPNTFAGLVSLEFLDLGDNKLTTLDPLVLSPLPRPFELMMDALLTQSPMVCDIKLCWLKVEAEVGNIVWKYSDPGFLVTREHGVYYPTCIGGVDWRSLPCPSTIPCRDPGHVEFAQRSGSFLPFHNNSQPRLDLPYSTDSELRYTCDPCYTGGGTIICQSNGQWTRKPECTRIDKNVVCRAPSVIDGYLTPSYDKYDCGVNVTFTCNHTETVGVCGPDGRFMGDIPGCVENKETVTATKGTGAETETGSPDQGNKPESGASEEGSSEMIYGIVGAAVGGIVVTAIIGLTIFCIIRSKKRNPSEADMVKTPNTAVGDEASEAGYTGLVTVDMKGKQGLNRQAEPTADRNTPGQRVAGDSTVYSNTAYEDEYQEIKDALPKEDPYEDVDEDAYEN